MNAATVILILLSLSSHVSAGSGLGKSKAAKGLGKLLPPHRMKGKSSTSGNRASASTVSSEIKITGCDDSRRQQIQEEPCQRQHCQQRDKDYWLRRLSAAANSRSCMPQIKWLPKPSATLTTSNLPNPTFVIPSGLAHMVTEAKRYLDDLEPTQPNLRYTVWFGAYDKSRHQTVLSNFKSMQNQATSITYHCETCPDDIFDSQPYAYLSELEGENQINLCPKFWKQPVTVASQAAKIVQELSRKLAKRDDVSGKKIWKVKDLAAEDPGRAVNNAANYMYL
ncbi:hypothetical protein RSAG8_10334, partial [Rhizoctonia solani AG-8 WAC10335]